MTSLRLSQVAVLGVLGAVSCTDRAGAGASGTSTSSGPGTSGSSAGGGGDDTTASEATASEPGKKGEIAFIRHPQGDAWQIYVMDLDGSNSRPLPSSQWAFLPRWSPDGSMLAYGRYASPGPVIETWVIDPESGKDTHLATEAPRSWWIAWSPDSSRIAFVTQRNGNQDIYVMAADGTGQTSLTDDPEPDYRPSWERGGRIFFTADRGGAEPEIYSMDETGGGQTNLTNNSVVDKHPVASPDGSRVVFLRTEGDIEDLYVMNADGTDQLRITPGPSNTDYYTARWSPDGRYIAFWSQQGPVVTIHRADADGTGLIDLTDVQARNEHASWTPDSQQIVFATNRHGDDGSIYIMNADGSNQTRLTNDPAWDHNPIVRPAP